MKRSVYIDYTRENSQCSAVKLTDEVEEMGPKKAKCKRSAAKGTKGREIICPLVG